MLYSGGFFITKKYSLEITLINKIRSFKDGVTFFDWKINLDLYKGDHKPEFEFLIEVFNTQLIDFRIYNVNHVEE